jgi:predicted ATPase
LNPYNAVGLGYQGELLVQHGQGERGAAYLSQALAKLHAARYELVTSTFMISMAQGLAQSGRRSEALATIDEAIRLIEANGDLLYMPEALRTKGEIAAGPGAEDPELAETCFQRSLDLAQRQGALAWELRAASSLAALRMRRRRIAEAKATLTPVYAQFSQGFETADLKRARVLLNQLASPLVLEPA